MQQRRYIFTEQFSFTKFKEKLPRNRTNVYLYTLALVSAFYWLGPPFAGQANCAVKMHSYPAITYIQWMNNRLGRMGMKREERRGEERRGERICLKVCRGNFKEEEIDWNGRSNMNTRKR